MERRRRVGDGPRSRGAGTIQERRAQRRAADAVLLLAIMVALLVNLHVGLLLLCVGVMYVFAGRRGGGRQGGGGRGGVRRRR